MGNQQSSSTTSNAASSPRNSTSDTPRPLPSAVSSLFAGARERSSSVSSLTLGRSKSNSLSSPQGPCPSTPSGLVDGGHLSPQGLYALRPAQHDYNQPIVANLILEKRLAPFYRGIEDYEEDWDDEQVIGAIKEVRATQAIQAAQIEREAAEGDPPLFNPPTATSTPRKVHKIGLGKDKDKISDKERQRREARAYKEAAECPICFLYYPPNINTSRCCQQPLCTECFVQIKRAEATITHIESEPACCPYCMEPEFGVIYESQNIANPETLVNSPSSDIVMDPRANGITSRRKSVSSKHQTVITIDQIRPDWEEKLNAIKAQAARRASRRIIMHRVGDRLIPVGYTSSRNSPGGTDTGPITTEMTQEAFQQFMSGGRPVRGSGRRSSRRDAEREGANDLEEMMIMEAMRLSMLEHEAQQKKEEEAKKKATEGAQGVENRLSQISLGDTEPSLGNVFLQPRSATSSSSSLRHSAPSSTRHTPYPAATSTIGSSPLASTSITRNEIGKSPMSSDRPDLINLDSDIQIETYRPDRRSSS